MSSISSSHSSSSGTSSSNGGNDIAVESDHSFGITVDMASGDIIPEFKYMTPVTRRFSLKKEFAMVKNRPYSTILMFCVVWGVYVWGISEIGWNNVHFSPTSPFSPPNPSFWFVTVENWPSCRDLRSEIWRLLSCQLTHTGLLHIGGNTLALILYGTFAESYYCFRSFGTFLTFQLSVVIGCLAQNLMYPYDGLVGCSAGVYGLAGLCVSQLIMNNDSMDEIAIFVGSFIVVGQATSDIISYFLMYSPSTAYFAHICGYASGIAIGFVSYSWKPVLWKRIIGVIGLFGLVAEIIYFSYHYSTAWPPSIINSSFRASSIASSCCAKYFDAQNDAYPASISKSDFECYNDVLTPIGHYY